MDSVYPQLRSVESEHSCKRWQYSGADHLRTCLDQPFDLKNKQPVSLLKSKFQSSANSDDQITTEENKVDMALQILVASIFLAVIGRMFYRLGVVRYLDYQASWLLITDRKKSRLTSNRGIACWHVNTAASFLQSYRKDGPWVSTESKNCGHLTQREGFLHFCAQ